MNRPMIVVAVTKSARAEEQMLRAKFGDSYDAYAERKGRIVPLLRGRPQHDDGASPA